MKKFLFLILPALLLLSCSGDDTPIPPPEGIDEQENSGEPIVEDSRTPCVGGMAGPYPCDGIDLLGHLSLQDLQASSGNDIWGWTDPDTGKEYAVMGLDNGTAFVDVSSDPLRFLGKLPSHSSNSPWRDVKVHGDYAFIVSEADGHGMQVFDLTRLRSVGVSPMTFSEDAHYAGVGNAHNLVINSMAERAYIVGTARDDEFSGGVHVIDISDPLNPMLLGGFGAQGYTHDAQVITYDGPDQDHQGKDILIGANETQLVIADLTDPQNPSTISTFTYPNLGYTHQGWFTADRRYFILGDETDELQFGFNSRSLIFDLTDLDQPSLAFTHTGSTAAIDHNGYVHEQRYFLSNYTAGLRVFDISGIAGGEFNEISFFDTYPLDDDPAFNGVWSVYPYFDSGKLIVGDINAGLFVLSESP